MKAKRMLANQIIMKKFQCICDTIRYDTRCYFNVRSKVSLIYLTKPTIKKWGKVKLKSKKRICSKVSVNSLAEFVESVVKGENKATVGRICRKGRFKPGMKE